MKKILITGSSGQVGSALVPALIEKYGQENVFTMDIKAPLNSVADNFINQDATDIKNVEAVIKKNNIHIIYHLVGLLSAGSEKDPDLSWKVNILSFKNILDLGRDLKLKRIFWPSSIGAFGPSTQQDNTPQRTSLEPTTIYGVGKVTGELLANYYHNRWGLDVRSLRYPGLITHAVEPADGTTEYSEWIFYDALKNKKYTCFLKEDTRLPMMYMDDAIRATIELMEADSNKLTVRTSYNITAFSFTPGELAAEIKKHIPEFEIYYEPDHRQKIADSWPKSIDDSIARQDWVWQHEYDLVKMTEEMIKNIKIKLNQVS